MSTLLLSVPKGIVRRSIEAKKPQTDFQLSYITKSWSYLIANESDNIS